MYISPNISTAEMDDMLQEIGNKVRTRKENALIAGDFNAKSSSWGMHFTYHREYLY